MAAVRRGQIKAGKLLMDKGADVNAKDAKGFTVLQFAAAGGHREVVKALIDRGAKVNLAAAACIGDLDQVRRLINEGINVNERGPSGETPIIAAATGGNPEVVKLLLEGRTDVTPETLQTALFVSASHGHAEVVKLLWKKALMSVPGTAGS